MTQDPTERDAAEIRRVIQEITEAWMNSRFERLVDLFHEDIVTLHPGFQKTERGKTGLIDSYRMFMEKAKVTDFKQSEFGASIWNQTAVACYRYEIAWEMEGSIHRETGHEVFVFTRAEERWLAVWRTLLPERAE